MLLSPSGERIRFEGCCGSSAVSSPRLDRFSEKLARPLVVLVGILDALAGAAAARGDASGFVEHPEGRTMRSCGLLSSSECCMASCHREGSLPDAAPG